jgi:hypothetical protein
MHLREPSAKNFALGLSYHATQRAHKPASSRKGFHARIVRVKVRTATAQTTGVIEHERSVARDDPHER